jgi:hypothetical protein
MTLLFWDFGAEGAIAQHHVDEVRNIVRAFDRPFARTAIPKRGQSFLFDGSEVDPAGPIGQMIRAFGSIDPHNMPHTNSCGQSGLGGLHVSAGLRPEFEVRFDDETALLARHSEYSSWARGRRGYELPLCLQMTVHLAPLPANKALFRFLERDLKAAGVVADSPHVITSGKTAQERIMGCGKATAAKIEGFFAANARARELALAAAAAQDQATGAGGVRSSSSFSSFSSSGGGGCGSGGDVGSAKRHKTKTSGRAPQAGRGAGACVLGEIDDLPHGMQAPPLVEYALTGAGAGRVVRVRFFVKPIVHSRQGVGKVDAKLEALTDPSAIRRLRKLRTEPPGLRFLRWPDQQTVLHAINKQRPAAAAKAWDETDVAVALTRRRTDAFFALFDVLVAAKQFTKPSAVAALKRNYGDSLPALANMTDSRDKSRFWPIPCGDKVPFWMVADALLFGALPPCPRCGQMSLLGSPSGWVSCKGWADRAADRPCCFQTFKGKGDADIMVGGAETAPSGGALALRRRLVMPCTGRAWEMPDDTKPANVREWRELLPEDLAELRGQSQEVKREKEGGRSGGMGAAAVVVKGEGL